MDGFCSGGQLLASQNVPGELLADDQPHRNIEALAVIQRLTFIILAIVVAKHLLIRIAEQMERLHADIRALQFALNQRPEVLQAVGVDVAANVFDGVVDDLMLEFIETFV